MLWKFSLQLHVQGFASIWHAVRGPALRYDIGDHPFQLRFNPFRNQLMRSTISMLLVVAIELQAIAIALGQSSDSPSLTALKSLEGIAIQEKDGIAIGVDLRKCNEVADGIFSKILDLPSLQSVAMSGLMATHERVRSLAALPNLRTLRVDQSLVTDQTVAEITKLPKLEDLNLEGCSLTEAALVCISQRDSLKRLRVAKTQITDRGLAHIGAMRQLELLDLSDCTEITNDGLVHLKELSRLRNLSLGSRKITESGLTHLASLTNMVAISFKECALADTGFEAIRGMSKLREFDIIKTRAGDRALGVIASSKEISKLKLRDSAITNQGIVEHIAKFQNLTVLDLGETETGDIALTAIGKLPKLEDLNLLRTKVSNVGVSSLTGLKLKRLNLDDIAEIGDGVVEHVAKIQTLEFLHLGKTAITDRELLSLQKLVHLKDLILTNTAVTESAIANLQNKLPKVKILR